MDRIRRAVPTLVLWAVVVLGVAIVLATHEWGLTVFRHATAMADDPLPGARRKPTAAEMEAARKSWMRRKFGSEVDGPTVEGVIDYHNRKGIGSPTPPDAIGPRE